MPTYTFNPDAAPESTSVDGDIYKQDASFSTAQGAASGDAADDSGGDVQVKVRINTGGASYQIFRGYLLFDTSAIPDGEVVISATIQVYVGSKDDDDNDGRDYICVYSSNPASNTALGTADYNQAGTTEFSDKVDIGNINTSAYNTFTFTADGLAAIDKTGVSKFSMREGHDVENETPVAAAPAENRITIYSADQGSNPPVLTVITAADSGSPMFFSSGGLAIA